MQIVSPARPAAHFAGAFLALAAAGVVILGSSSAHAQTCSRTDTATTECRFVLSQPRAFTVVVNAKVRTPAPVSKAVQITVDGRTCRQPRFSPFEQWIYVEGSCPVSLAAGSHTVVATLLAQARGSDGKAYALPSADITPSAFKVALASSGRLADLPREAGELNPKPSGHHLWFLLF